MVTPRPAQPQASAVRTRLHGGHDQPRPRRGAREPALGAPRRCPSLGRPAGHAAELPGSVSWPPGRVPRRPSAFPAVRVGRIAPRAAPRGGRARGYQCASYPCRPLHRCSRARPATVPQLPEPARWRRQHCYRPHPDRLPASATRRRHPSEALSSSRPPGGTVIPNSIAAPGTRRDELEEGRRPLPWLASTLALPSPRLCRRGAVWVRTADQPTLSTSVVLADRA